MVLPLPSTGRGFNLELTEKMSLKKRCSLTIKWEGMMTVTMRRITVMERLMAREEKMKEKVNKRRKRKSS